MAHPSLHHTSSALVASAARRHHAAATAYAGALRMRRPPRGAPHQYGGVRSHPAKPLRRHRASALDEEEEEDDDDVGDGAAALQPLSRSKHRDHRQSDALEMYLTRPEVGRARALFLS